MNGMGVTSLVAAAFALLLVALSGLVSLRRARLNAVFGDAGDDTLRRRIRAHANFIEYAPLAVIVVGLLEYQGAAQWLVGLIGAAFVVSRVLHAVGMLYGATAVVRGIAMLLNHGSFIGAGVWLLLTMFLK